MTEINGQKVIYSNDHNKYAVTVDKNCKICGDHFNIYWIDKTEYPDVFPRLVSSLCEFDLAELIPSILSYMINNNLANEDYFDHVRDCIS